MTFRRIAAATTVAMAIVTAAGSLTPAAAATQREIIADGVAQSFTLRASVDQGGNAPIPFFFGSYADANLTSPPAGADGQASWYNLGIAETAAFTPPGECTPEEQQHRVEQAVKDVRIWLTETAIPLILQGKTPVVPLPTVPCSERLPGFSQSRYPPTENIKSSSSHDLVGNALCSNGSACTIVKALDPVIGEGGLLEGGRFTATATDKPSQSSDAMVAGLHIPGIVDIASARSLATTRLDGERFISEASWTATDVCVVPVAEGCTVAIKSVRQLARIVRDTKGSVIDRQARTVIAGVQGGNQDQEVTAADLGPGLPPIDLGGHLFIRAVSTTGGCGTSSGVADAGGLEIFGHGQDESSLPPTGLPIVGSATGGGLLLGGACASGRLSAVNFDLPGTNGPGGIDIPGRTVVRPPGTLPGAAGGGAPLLSAPRVVRKSAVRYELRTAPAWRTARYWGTTIAALALLGLLAFVFRRSRPVVPVVAAVDRFARRFIRG